MTQFLTPGSQILNYLVFPKFLLEIDDLNETAKILYMILLDRARLSQKNDRWTDENGHVYLFFTIPSLADAMHKSEMTIKTALKALEEKQLIYRKRQGIGRPNRIYVKYPDALPSTDKNLSIRETENCLSERQDLVCQKDRNLSGSKNKKNKYQERNRWDRGNRIPYGPGSDRKYECKEEESL